ncbi:MAG: SDR family oxidoreductase [Deltaproteobacteria bacterium]|nr:MAG: SDR family oxidoreductase [Deltaproteobacteria bacterium]
MSRAIPSPESQRVFAPGTFDGHVAVVTGGGTGIGLATASELVRLGARVAICSRKRDNVDRGVAQLAAIAGAGRVYGAVCDIREPDSVEAFVAGVLERFDTIDILVNNAGGQFPSPAQMITPKGFHAVVRNNLVGTFTMTREVATRAMIPRKRGRICSVTACVYRGFPGMAHTGAARAGVENLTMSLAVEWAQFGITVNAVAPGIIESSGVKQYPAEVLELGIRNTPLKRAGSVEETAASIVFLVSPAAQFITGAVLRVDGGKALWGDTWVIPDDA